MSSTTFDSYLIPLEPKAPKTTAPVAADKLWASARPVEKANENRTVYVDDNVVSLVSVGPDFAKKSQDAKREVVRKAVAVGIKALREAGAKSVGVDTFGEPHDAAVGASLALFKFTLKTKDEEKPAPKIQSLEQPSGDAKSLGWNTGLLYANAQNLARELMELPANYLTPTAFCDRVKKEFEGVENVEIHVRDEAWAQEKGMRTFLSVTKGTSEPAKFLELHYNGGSSQDKPLAFVGKGITFDSGGISLKPAADMKLMRGDMGGAATVVSAALAIAKLRLPINLVVVTPLCENLPGPSANKPGDVITAMNGKTVEVDNTDAEGRLILADALTYVSTTFKPHTILDVATLTGAMVIALGSVYTGVFSTSESLWKELHAAGEAEFDRFWRMPLDEGFSPQISGSNADLCNTGGRPGGSCTAALFLKSFVDGIEGDEPSVRWAHIDIAGTMEATRPDKYQNKGMTGRPVRALIEFARRSVD